MTAIFYDLERNLLACDSQTSDSEGNPINLNAIKFGLSEHLVSVAAGTAELCDKFNSLISNEQYQEAIDFLKEQSPEKLAPITIHIDTGDCVKDLSRGLCKTGCSVIYQGSGGDFLRHNYITNDNQLDVAYNLLIKDKHSYSGGLMRTYDFTSGANNMKEVDFKVAANDNKTGYRFPVGQPTFDSNWTDSTNHKKIKSFKELFQ